MSRRVTETENVAWPQDMGTVIKSAVLGTTSAREPLNPPKPHTLIPPGLPDSLSIPDLESHLPQGRGHSRHCHAEAPKTEDERLPPSRRIRPPLGALCPLGL